MHTKKKNKKTQTSHAVHTLISTTWIINIKALPMYAVTDAEQRCVMYHVEHGKGSNLQHKDKRDIIRCSIPLVQTMVV